MNALLIIAAEGPNGRWWPSDVKEFWWGAIAFGIVALLMAWKLLPLVSKGLSGAQESAVADATAADQAMADAQAEEQALRNDLGDAEAAGQRLIDEAHQTAAQVRTDGAARTEQLLAEAKERGVSDVAAMRTQANTDISNEISSKALGAAEAVVESNLDDATHASLIEDYIAKIGTRS